MSGMIDGQLALFSSAIDEPVNERAQWASRFDRAPWVAQHDCGLGPAGTVISGWTCPACRLVEVNELILAVNHGYHPRIPGWTPRGAEFGRTCTRLGTAA